MKSVEELIRSLDHTLEREENEIIKLNLDLIKGLIKKVQNSQERIYIDKIVDTFCEIIEIQRDIINESDYADMIAAGYGPDSTSSFVPSALNITEDALAQTEIDKSTHSYLPLMGEFQTDEQVRKAFYNYLKYHTVKETKDGRQKQLSKHTIYDYCSRIRVLYESFYKDLNEGKLEGKVPVALDNIIPGKTFLNAYHNISALQFYVDIKGVEIREKASIIIEDATNPLNNPKNLGNTIAALAKFTDFKNSVLHHM